MTIVSYCILLSCVGYLCGDCKDSKGVSTLLNRCVDCGDINALFLAALCKCSYIASYCITTHTIVELYVFTIAT